MPKHKSADQKMRDTVDKLHDAKRAKRLEGELKEVGHQGGAWGPPQVIRREKPKNNKDLGMRSF